MLRLVLLCLAPECLHMVGLAKILTNHELSVLYSRLLLQGPNIYNILQTPFLIYKTFLLVAKDFNGFVRIFNPVWLHHSILQYPQGRVHNKR